MALTIQNLNPHNGATEVEVNSSVTIQFSEPVDPFTLIYGISLYTIRDSIWSGPDLAMLDTKWSDVLNAGDDYVYFPLKYSISGSDVTITPVVPLAPERKHFISIVPGNDSTRFISAATASPPEYTRVASSTGELAIVGTYTGTVNSTYVIDKTALGFDITKGPNYLGTFVPVNTILDIGEIKLKVVGTFDTGDSVSIDVFKARGVEVLYKSEFTTSAYQIVEPRSTSVNYITEHLDDFTFEITASNPEDRSANNLATNPITVKFNRDVDLYQDLSGKIRVTKTNINTGIAKELRAFTKVNGNIVKIYLSGV